MKKRIIIFTMIWIFIVLFAIIVLHDSSIYDETFLTEKNGVNLFDYTNKFLFENHNSLVTKEELSTGMYTGSNNKNYYAIFKIKPNDPLLKEILKQGQANIVFESKLQGTTEWVVDNKYKISMYYQSKDDTRKSTYFFSQTWVGADLTISNIQSIPKEAIGSDIYIRYESILGSVLFIPNGNDLRFFDNYLAVEAAR